MRTLWKRIHTWLEANAPAGYGHLRPGASAEAIRATEIAMGLKLPDEVKESYCIHDGQDQEPGLIGGEGWRLLPLQEMVKIWSRWSHADPEVAHHVPIAWGEMGDFVFLNLAPGSEEPGSLLVQRRDRSHPDRLSSSFRSWLEDFAEQLEKGEIAYSEKEGCLMYVDEIDLD